MAYKGSQRQHYFIEALAAIALLLLINQLWFSDNFGYLGVSPNPYWLVVIFIAFRYGGLAGMFAGLMCAVALLLSTIFNILHTTDRLWYQIPYKQWQLAGLFVFLGFLIGQERSRVDRIVDILKEKFNKLRNEFENLVMDNLALKKINTELEGRILGQTDTVSTIYEVAKSLTNVRIEEIYPSITSLVKRILGAEKCSIYVWEEGEYMLKNEIGKRSEKTLSLDSDIVKLVLESKKIVTVKDVISDKGKRWEEGKDPPMIAPLFFGEAKDTASGLIIVEEIPFTKLNPDSINFLALMADWVSRSLDNIYTSSHIHLEDIYDKEMDLFRYDYGLRRLREEMLRTRVTGAATSLMLLKIKDFDSCPIDGKTNTCREVGLFLKDTMRASDTITQTEDPCIFMLVFPGADSAGVKAVRKRIMDSIKDSKIKPYKDAKRTVEVGTSLITVDEKSHYTNESDVVRDAKKNLNI